jgi:hypothetical protein
MNRMAVPSLAALVIVACLVNVTLTSKHVVGVVHASNGCTNDVLSGDYALIQPAGLSGTSHGKALPWQFVGVQGFDGAGNTSVKYTAAIQGQIFTDQTSAGTYTVNSDCTGSMTMTSGVAAGLTANFAVASKGKELYGIITVSGDTATFIEKQQ